MFWTKMRATTMSMTKRKRVVQSKDTMEPSTHAAIKRSSVKKRNALKMRKILDTLKILQARKNVKSNFFMLNTFSMTIWDTPKKTMRKSKVFHAHSEPQKNHNPCTMNFK